MSHSNTSDDEGSIPSHTLTQTRMQAPDDEGEEKQHAAQFSPLVSPATRLHRHALESILGMLTLNDLARIVAVSRSWAAAVRSMAPIRASIQRDYSRSIIRKRKDCHPLPPIARIVGSPLLRHLAAVHIRQAGVAWTPLNCASLGLLAQHAPNLTLLWSDLILTPNERFVWPAKLQSLALQLHDPFTDAAINGMLTSLAALPSLSVLRLSLLAFSEDQQDNDVNLSILGACPSLTSLKLETARQGIPTLTAADSDLFLSGTFAALRRQMDDVRRARAVSATARHGTLARHRACVW